MKFALIDGNRTEAIKGAKGICPRCSSELISKCGEVKMNHWAHKGIRNCDQWWEPETEWHRSWKDNFPVEWQEFSLTDQQTGEKHIADIHTSQEVVIEFQHSHIDPQEQIARENFYQNLIWVVDGTLLKYDFPRFIKRKRKFITLKPGIFRVEYPEETFPSAWIASSVPVIFDFLGTEIFDSSKERNPLYCLYPKLIGSYVVLAEMPRKAFIKTVIDGQWLMRLDNLKKLVDQLYNERQNQIAILQLQDDLRLQMLKRQILNQNRSPRL